MQRLKYKTLTWQKINILWSQLDLLKPLLKFSNFQNLEKSLPIKGLLPSVIEWIISMSYQSPVYWGHLISFFIGEVKISLLCTAQVFNMAQQHVGFGHSWANTGCKLVPLLIVFWFFSKIGESGLKLYQIHVTVSWSRIKIRLYNTTMPIVYAAF